MHILNKIINRFKTKEYKHTYLLDENVLGFRKYLPNYITTISVGDNPEIPKKSSDTKIMEFAKENNLVIITVDANFAKRIKEEGMNVIQPVIRPEFIAKQINWQIQLLEGFK